MCPMGLYSLSSNLTHSCRVEPVEVVSPRAEPFLTNSNEKRTQHYAHTHIRTSKRDKRVRHTAITFLQFGRGRGN